MSALGGEKAHLNGPAPLAPPHRRPRYAADSEGGYKDVLQNRKFLRLWAAQIISQTNMNAANYGLITLIATETRSLTATAGAIVAFSLPALLIGAPAGVLVDRLDRRGVLLVSNILRGLASLAFVGFLLLDRTALLPIYLLTFFISMVGQFFGPAEGAAIPKLVKPKSLMNALALFNITFTISQALGLIIIGPLILLTVPLLPRPISQYPAETLFMMIAALYFVCVWLISRIPAKDLRALPDESGGRNRRPERPWADMWGAIGQTIHYVVTRPLLTIALFQLSLAGVVTAVIAMIAPNLRLLLLQPPTAVSRAGFYTGGHRPGARSGYHATHRAPFPVHTPRRRRNDPRRRLRARHRLHALRHGKGLATLRLV